jgi:hypothetical protein
VGMVRRLVGRPALETGLQSFVLKNFARTTSARRDACVKGVLTVFFDEAETRKQLMSDWELIKNGVNPERFFKGVASMSCYGTEDHALDDWKDARSEIKRPTIDELIRIRTFSWMYEGVKHSLQQAVLLNAHGLPVTYPDGHPKLYWIACLGDGTAPAKISADVYSAMGEVVGMLGRRVERLEAI